MNITNNLQSVLSFIPKDVTLVAVSKTKPTYCILEAFKRPLLHPITFEGPLRSNFKSREFDSR